MPKQFDALARRDFLRAGAVMTLASCWPGTYAMADATSRRALQSYSLKELHLHYLLPLVRTLGISEVELYDRHISPFSSPRDLRAAVGELATNGVRARAFYSDAFTNDELTTHSILSFGIKLGVELFSTGAPSEALVAANRLAPRYRLGVAIHNASDPESEYFSIDDVRATLDELSNLSACVDVGNFFRGGFDPVDAIEALGGRIAEVHIKDVDASGAHTLLGDGVLDLPAILAALERARFDGLLTLEYGGEPDDIAARVARLSENVRRFNELS